MRQFSFWVPGEPRAKGRPRTAVIKGRARVYTDAETASYQNLVKLACNQAMAGAEPIAGPVQVVISAHLKPPASGSKKRLQEMLAGARMPTKRPDIENITKVVLDGMNQIAFADDSQVVNLVAAKRWAAEPGVRVWVSEADRDTV
jgi:Holliday junction resolvase RusA-like endonuclease